MRFRVISRRSNTQPVGIFLQRGQEFFQPLILIAMLEGAWPHSEFFHIVAEYRDSVRVHGCHLT